MSNHTHEELNPDPPAWPQCGTCGTAYVLRRCLSLSKGFVWLWQKDCEKPKSACKGATPVLVNADGQIDPDSGVALTDTNKETK